MQQPRRSGSPPAASAAPRRKASNTGSNTVSRRALLRGGSAMAVAATATPFIRQTAQAQPAEPPPAMRSARSSLVGVASAGLPSLPPLGVIVFNRMGFGPRPGDMAKFSDMAQDDDARLQNYVDQQLNPAGIDDNRCDSILAEQGFTTLDKSLEQLWADHVLGEADRRAPTGEVERAAFLRAVYSERQLLEVLADHWHNHFNVYGWDYWIAPIFVHYDRDVIRQHLLGNFRAMLGAVAKSPAMLYYLDNQSNSGDKPNENYARELFELHVMGAENYLGIRDVDDPDIVNDEGNRIGYIDSDVYGATTCFTGWRVDTDTGKFVFDESRHFPYSKFVLGEVIQEFQGIQDGEIVLDLLAFHPGSARYICRGLCRRLISDHPPERIVQEAADVFMANQNAPDQLKKVVRTILLSPEFRTTWGEKIKRPFEYSTGILRALNANFQTTNTFFWSYAAIGQQLFNWRPPDGYPDDRQAWSGTMAMLQRWRHCNYLFSWKTGDEDPNPDVHRLRPETQTPKRLRTPNELVDYWSRRILGRRLPAEEREPVLNVMAAGRNPDYDLPEDEYADRLRHVVALICLSPSFHWR